MTQSDYDLDKLFSYVYNSEKYRTKLEASIENKLYEYSTVLVWKNIVLFIYEKLFQIKVLGNNLPDAFNKQLRNGNITVHTCFDFCCINDDSIYTNLHRIWNNVEANYKQMFKGLLDDRNSLSHVNRYEEDFNEQWFKTYFEKALKFLQYLQNLNNIQLSHKTYGFIDTNKTIQYFSEEDINYLLSQESYEDSKIIINIIDNNSEFNYSDNLKTRLKEESIHYFLKSNSYYSAFSNGERMIRLSKFFECADVKKVLKGILDDTKDKHQIVPADNMEEILEDLFDKTINIEGLEEIWKDFISEIIQYMDDKYKKLKIKYDEIYGEQITAESE